MERETLQPEPPKVPTSEAPKAPQLERSGLFERWRKKDKNPEASSETPEKPKRVRKKLGEFIFKSAEQPPTPQVTPETADQPEVFDRAGRARRFARLVLARVVNTARNERIQPEPLGTEVLQDAAEDLQEADQELGETLQASHAEAAGLPEITPDLDFETPDTSPAARIVERVSKLERRTERNRAQAIAAVGLGVIAVLVAGHEYLGHKRTEKKQRQSLAQQEAEFARLRQTRQQVTAMDRPERQAYYDRLSQFTHNQAEVTRDITREVLQTGGQAELHIQRAPETAPRPEPLAQVEAADNVELGPSKNDPASTKFIGGSAAGGIPGAPVSGEEDLTKAPLSPVALRQKALQDARTARLRSNAWMYGVAFAGVLVIIAVLLIFG